jgi:hypothetical protein
MPTEWWFSTLLRVYVFEVVVPIIGNFEMTGERRTYLMAAQPNRYSTLAWHKSSVSADGGNCVEVASLKSYVLVRNSRDRSGAVLELTSAQWGGLLRRIKAGELGLNG